MEDIQQFVFDMFIGNATWAIIGEICLRTMFMYLFTLIIIRLIGKRGMGQMTPFEYLIIIAMGSSVGDPMFYLEIPLVFGFVVLVTIVILQQSLTKLSQWSRVVHRIAESSPTILIDNGEIVMENLQKEKIDKEELFMKVREKNVCDISDIKKAYIEPSGTISIFTTIPKNPKQSTLP